MRIAIPKTRVLVPVIALALAGLRLAPSAGSSVAAAADSAAAPSAVAPAGAPPAGPVPHLVLPAGPLQATEQFQWDVQIRVVNSTPSGVYLDSLCMEFTDLYAGSMRRGSTELYTVTKVAQLLPSVSAGDSGHVQYSGPAFAEAGRIRMRLHVHTADGTHLITPDATVDMAPAPVAVRFPSSFIENKGKKIEFTAVPETWPSRASPAVIVIHSEDGQGRDWLPLAWDLSNRGYACVLVSLPGHGFSTGPPDFAGPTGVKAASRVLDMVRRFPSVDSTRVALWGISEGATVAALLAAQRNDLRAIVLQSGVYDLAGTDLHTDSDDLRRRIETQAGPRAGWKSRSPLLAGAWPKAHALILHGDQDRVVPVGQATAFAAALRAAGDSVIVQVFEGAGHRVPMAAARDAALEFLKLHLAPLR